MTLSPQYFEGFEKREYGNENGEKERLLRSMIETTVFETPSRKASQIHE